MAKIVKLLKKYEYKCIYIYNIKNINLTAMFKDENILYY